MTSFHPSLVTLHTSLIAKLDDFPKLSDRNILTHAGKVSQETARLKAESEFDTFRAAQAALPQPVDQHFKDAINELKKIEKQLKNRRNSSPREAMMRCKRNSETDAEKYPRLLTDDLECFAVGGKLEKRIRQNLRRPIHDS